MIYFIQSQSGPIKIGYSRSAERRLYDLQISNPEKLILLGTVSGGKDKESDLHERFADLSLGGEWFKPEKDLLDYIAYSKEDLSEESGPKIPENIRLILIEIGKNIKLARLRRHITIQALADEMGTGLRALSNIENGNGDTTISNYLRALLCLGFEKDIQRIAADDVLGRKIQDDELLNTRASRSNKKE